MKKVLLSEDLTHLKKISFISKRDPEKTKLWCSGWAGFSRALKLEYPGIDTLYIDVNSNSISDQSIEKLAKKITGNKIGNEIFIDDKGLVYSKAILPFHGASGTNQSVNFKDLVISENDVIVVVGGGRGMTAECIKALAQKQKYQFILIGRTDIEEQTTYLEKYNEPLLTKEIIDKYKLDNNAIPNLVEMRNKAKNIINANHIRDSIQVLESYGSTVQYYSVDVSDVLSLNKIVNLIYDKYNKIDAIVYGAGIILDSLIKIKPELNFEAVLNSKIKGLKNILSAVKNGQLKKIVLFSSVSAFYGNVWQSDYACANETLNNISEYLNGKGINSTSIMWPPLEGGMNQGIIKEYFKKYGVQIMPLIEMQSCFLDVLTNKYNNVPTVLYTNASLHWYLEGGIH